MKPPKCWLTGYKNNNSNNNDQYNNVASKNGKNLATTKFGEGDDTFRHYMARKIHLQRNQFGLRLPPKPSTSIIPSLCNTSTGLEAGKEHRQVKSYASQYNETYHQNVSDSNTTVKSPQQNDIPTNNTSNRNSNSNRTHKRNVTFHPSTSMQEENIDHDDHHCQFPGKNEIGCEESDSDSGGGMQGLLQRLKQQHKEKRMNKNRKRKERKSNEVSSQMIKKRNKKKDMDNCDENYDGINFQNDSELITHDHDNINFSKDEFTPLNGNKHIDDGHEQHVVDNLEVNVNLKNRPDLFFWGVVILVNGFTDPCGNTLMRMLHKHGGDMEKYETVRVTHIIASELSHAKRLIYQKQRNPIPVVKPQWVVDSVSAYQKLPIHNYLLLRPEDDNFGKKIPSLDFFFTTQKKQTSFSHKNNEHIDCNENTHNLDRNRCTFHLNENKNKQTKNSGISLLSSPDRENNSSNSLLLKNDSSNTVRHQKTDKLRNYTSSMDNKECADNINLEEKNRIKQSTNSSNFPQTNHHSCDTFIDSVSKNESYKLNIKGSKIDDPVINNLKTGDEVPPNGKKNVNKLLQSETGTSTCKIIKDLNAQDHPNMKCSNSASSNTASSNKNTDSKKSCIGSITLPNGVVRTVGNDPNFLESYFRSSRLSFIGSFKQRSSNTNQPSYTSNFDDKTKNATRFVFHIDMDCFFAAVALRKYPQYRNKPVAISHAWRSDNKYHKPIHNTENKKLTKASTSELSTCNYEARKYGIRKGMFLHRARKLCPDLKILPYDYAGYEEVSKKVSSILQTYAGQYGGTLEEVSCDESYLEIFFQNEYNDNDDDIASFDGKKLPLIERLKKIANDIRSDIVDSTECTASVGVGSNKFQAKLATDKVKPNGVHVIQNILTELKSLKLRDLPGVGYKMERKLNEFGLNYVRDVWDLDDGSTAGLCQLLGITTGKKILNFCKGIDDRPVRAPPRKTIGAECNYGVRFNGPYGVDFMINGLAEEVEKRMEIVRVTGHRVTLKVKERKEGAGPPGKFNGHGSCHDHSRSSNIISTSGTSTRDSQIISRTATKLFQDMKIDPEKIRGMGIIISKLLDQNETNKCTEETETSNISSWLTDTNDNSNSNVTKEKNKSPEKKQLENESEIKKTTTKPISSERPRKLPKRSILNKEENTRMKQMSVKRMLKLACVKSGKDLASKKFGGEAVSLTQLDCLPLDIQLQIVNGDERTNGTNLSSTKKKVSSINKADFFLDNNNQNKSGKEESRLNAKERYQLKQEILVEYNPIIFNERNFYVDTVVPLRNWMDECPEPEQEDFNKISQFFRILIDEKRLDEVVRLFRLIKKRSDVWGHMYKACLLQETNQYLEMTEERVLDIEWLGL